MASQDVEKHWVVIQRNGRSHRALCKCGWRGVPWNELRPAEADAWHHVFGDNCIVDLPAISAPLAIPAEPLIAMEHLDRRPESGSSGSIHDSRSLERLVGQATALANSASPYRQQTVSELWRAAGQDRALVEAAISEISGLLESHGRHNGQTADSRWLQLLTARRLLQETLGLEQPSSSV